ncbi:ABC transporter substrate-binding protein [Halocatena marina]|uniref:ABC transporter substrate-binding protein n=1 Tax=Halocatena marina TaxID=2934937 RepID=UPI002815C0A4|nr:ABC transporter substrate-binding protein [Halocatena marina]
MDGQSITLVKGDTEATVAASVTAARKRINDENVRAFIGPTNLTFTGVKDLIVENNVPVVTPTAGTTELDSVGGNHIFRTVSNDS